MPYHQDFAMFNKFIHTSNLKFVFSSRNTIGHAVVDKKHLVRDSTKQPKSGVYCITCTSPGCNHHYYGRTMKDLHVRTNQHSDNIHDGELSSALVQHINSHPGHSFEPASAQLIWNTRNKYESQLVEASCIKMLPHCNISEGDITVGNAVASFTTRLAGLHKLMVAPKHSRRHSTPLYTSRVSVTSPASQLPHSSTQSVSTLAPTQLLSPPQSQTSSSMSATSLTPSALPSTSSPTSQLPHSSTQSSSTSSPNPLLPPPQAQNSSSRFPPPPTQSALSSSSSTPRSLVTPSTPTMSSQPARFSTQSSDVSPQVVSATQPLIIDLRSVQQLPHFSPRRSRQDKQPKNFRALR